MLQLVYVHLHCLLFMIVEYAIILSYYLPSKIYLVIHVILVWVKMTCVAFEWAILIRAHM